MAATFAAWALMTMTDLVPLVTTAGIRPPFWRIVMFYAVAGLPFAAGVTFAAGGLAWLWGRKAGRLDGCSAVRAGAVVGLVLGTISLAITAAAHGGSRFQREAYGMQVVQDGELTAAGWGLELIELVGTVAIGAAVGWVAWHAAQPGRPRSGRP